MMKFSIVTPSYNQGRYIKDTIESVLQQNYSNYEHIIVDGGSTDDTIDILKQYPHLHWISEKDKGAAEAINKGFKLSSGDIITWLNSDDYFAENIFTSINNYFTNNDEAQFIYGNRNVVFPEENKIFTEKTEELNAHKLIHINADIVRQPCSFYKRKLLDKIGFLDESLKLVFDYELFIRFFLQTKPVYINQTFAFQRDYETTLSRRFTKKQVSEIFRVSRKYGSKLTDPIMYNSILKKLLFPWKT
jgi:glycosyltransferase involved in cell wall biosynthesis